MFEITDAIARAQCALDLAYNHFNEATERRLVDAATYELSVAMFRYDAAVERAKEAVTFVSAVGDVAAAAVAAS